MKILNFDQFDPESIAMLQALYSRSSESVVVHAEKVLERGSAKFMESFYVGYGHASIGDCGTTTLFIENVSMLATKAIQDNPLYSGQESSTRYIDFSQQKIINPGLSSLGEKIQSRWLDFYLSNQEQVEDHLKKRFPINSGENANIWSKAIKARTFDVLRGFLPAGITTQLSWSTNLRQAHENICRLKAHPLEEVQAIASELQSVLKNSYPNSFSHKSYSSQDKYLSDVYGSCSYLKNHSDLNDGFEAKPLIQDVVNSRDLKFIIERPEKTTLPRNIANLGRYKIICHIDYGSFRDLQRHRNGYCPIPLLGDDIGFHDWYLDQLPDDLRIDAENLICEQKSATEALASKESLSEYDIQYFLPMGYKVQCELEYDLSQLLYVSELRSSVTVHPTLRVIAQKMALFIRNQIPNIPVYSDDSLTDFDIRRGLQDIVEKKV
ncbi:FAD-dependent thymidylate synthase [Arenicella sp. 4NH20-0111]|uniref:FAD-dependent thymidylate synthase n=1 Tax=Arenicella sp. 4NH20-0111 TaxID=3127648 RepID=UPI00310A7464